MVNDESGNKNMLNNPAMDSGLQNDRVQEKQKPSFANEAQLLAGKNVPVGMPEHQIQDDSIKQEGGVSYFKDTPKPIGYVEPQKNKSYTAPQQTSEVTNIHSGQQFAETPKQHNLQVNANQLTMAQLTNDAKETLERHGATVSTESAQKSQPQISKQEVFDLLQEQNRPNLAGRFAAMSAHVESSQMTDENKADAQQRLNQATLTYAGRVDDKEISPIDIHMVQQVNEKNLERG